MFVSLFYALIDLKERSLTYVEVEDNQPVIIEGGTTGDLIVLEAKGTPLGVSNANIEENSTSLSTGDTVVLYTDGVVKAVNEKREEFDKKGLMTLIENNQDSYAQDLIQKIKEEVLLFTGNTPRSDDITSIVLKDKGAQEISLDTKGVRDYLALLKKLPKSQT